MGTAFSSRYTWGTALAVVVVAIAGGIVLALPTQGGNGRYVLVGWNNLGMHCMDSEYSLFSILPPYNTIHAQLVDGNGKLVRDATGVTVTYEAVADASGSINTTSQGKTDFWDHALDLYGSKAPVDTGLTGNKMPGTGNVPQPMLFDATKAWFIGEGIPLTPYDDNRQRNTYPMMRLVARDASGTLLASTSIVLPVSDEMDCRSCHASNSSTATQPAGGWANLADPLKDYKTNILLLHDSRQNGSATYATALANAGYNALGLYPTAQGGKSVLCAKCHASNALPGTGMSGIPPLTTSVHGMHAHAVDPTTGQTLDDSSNRAACYRCHPGSTTGCLRGVMGNAVAPDGTMLMQCQSCHGTMSQVGAPGRQGWLQEPNCQNCHTGTATSNSGQIQFTSVFDGTGQPRVATDPTFATNPDTPAAGLSLYRFSTGHGGLACEACHGSTHAEFPSSHASDNVQSQTLQGYSGALAECSTCHASNIQTVTGGPHGMHPIGQTWVSSHGDLAQGGTAGCQPCHGTDSRGTVLSRTRTDRSFVLEGGGAKQFPAGTQVACFDCHGGPGGPGNAAPPSVDLAATWGGLTQTAKTARTTQRFALSGTLVVKNAGKTKSKAAAVGIYLSLSPTPSANDLLIKKLSTGALKPGQTKTLKLNIKLPTGVSASGKYVTAKVDYTNLILETNETNNTAVFGPLP
ncbi:MAG TPA: CARDB domain-containing protein [Planctomycetota bacterium]